MTSKIDHIHPLYLSSSDVTGAVQIGIQLVGMENYNLWSRAMKLTLLTKNKLGFIDGSIKREDYTVVLRRSSGIDVMQCHARSQILMMNTSPTVNQCYAMIIQDESQRELSGDQYNLGGQMDPTTLFTSGSGGNNFNSQSNRSGNVKLNKQRSGYLYCDHCDMRGHNRAECNKLKYCIHCHKHGHLKDSCYQLIGYPTNYKGKRQTNIMTTDYNSQFNNPGSSTDSNVVDQMQKFKGGGSQQMLQQHGINSGSGGSGAVLAQHFTPNQYQQVLQMMNKSLIHKGNTVSTNSNANATGIFAGHSQFTPSTSSFDWIVDSGATDHMVRTKDLLTHGSTVKSSGHVQLPNGDSTKVTHSGCSQLQGGEVVKNVLYVPELNFNLLSVAKLTRKLNCCAIFYPDFFFLQYLFTGKVKEIGEENGGLYILKSPQLINTGQHKSLVAVKNSAEGEVWHKRLGHIPMSVIRKIDMFAHKRDFQLTCCYICPLARQFLAMVKTQFNVQVKMFRSDNGGEFFNAQVSELFNSQGIIQ
ncbi:uncharacterized protein [Solanum lycopersicum]|uniref:uncharacterized protein n=1 Tax=Solanum lycopersicum TaxID=4081 RepID=UPI00374A48B5